MMRNFVATAVALLFVATGAVAVPAPVGAPADVSPSSVTATGATTARTAADRAAERINVKDFGAKCDGTTDDSAAFVAAINRSNALTTAMKPSVVYVPSGQCRIVSALPSFVYGGGIVGDGEYKSTILVDPAYVGDLFSWSDAWFDGGLVFNGATYDLTKLYVGARVANLSIIGNRSALAQQNAFVFYDRADAVNIENVTVNYLRGRCLSFGQMKTQPVAFMRESRFNNIRFFSCGDTNTPVWEDSASGTSAQTSETIISNVDIYAPYGPGFVIRNNSAGSTTADRRISNLRVEGLEGNPAGITADLMVLGGATDAGTVAKIKVSGLELLNPYSGYAALRVTGSSATVRPTNIDVQGIITGVSGTGYGLVVEAGRNMAFRFAGITTTQTNVTVGSNTLVGSNIRIESTNGAENTWTWSVDSTSLTSVLSGGYKIGNPAAFNTLRFSLAPSDGTATGSGGAIGPGAVNLMADRAAANQIPSGKDSALIGGNTNIAAGNYSGVFVGNNNTIAGANSVAVGGIYANDFGRTYAQMFASGPGTVFTRGSSQLGRFALRGSSSTTAAARLTSDKQAASGFNCVNIQDSTVFNLSVQLAATDNTTPGNSYIWHLPIALLQRTAGTVTMPFVGTPVSASTGTGSTASVSIAADNANKCVALNFTPPTGNTDAWDVVAEVRTAEVQ